MMHNVYLQGELGEKFGHKFVVDATSYQDVIRCINANRPEFKQYLVDCHHNDIGFIFDTAGKEVEEEIELFADGTFKNLSLSKLKELLKKAVLDEDYEVAAKIRDEISKR